jgi:hypothetical protein
MSRRAHMISIAIISNGASANDAATGCGCIESAIAIPEWPMLIGSVYRSDF